MTDDDEDVRETNGGLDDPDSFAPPSFKATPRPRQAPPPGLLTELISVARAELQAETPVRLHTSHAPKLTDADGSATHDTDEGGVGLPFTGAFHRLLSIRERPRQTEYLMRGSFDAVGDWCLKDHPNHDLTGLRLPVCKVILLCAVRSGLDTHRIALLMALPEPEVRSILIRTLQYAAQWRQGKLRAKPKTAADLVIEDDARRRTRRARMYDTAGA